MGLRKLAVIATALAASGCSDKAFEVKDAPSQLMQRVEAGKQRNPSFDFKGVKIGSKEDKELPFLVAQSTECRTLVKSKKDGGCTTVLSYAGITPKYVSLQVREQSLYSVSITLESHHFDEVLQAMIEKFGPPASLNEDQLQNAFGAKFMNRSAQWEAGDGSKIFATKYITDIATSSVSIYSKSAFDALMEASKTAKPKSADL